MTCSLWLQETTIIHRSLNIISLHAQKVCKCSIGDIPWGHAEKNLIQHKVHHGCSFRKKQYHNGTDISWYNGRSRHFARGGEQYQSRHSARGKFNIFPSISHLFLRCRGGPKTIAKLELWGAVAVFSPGSATVLVHNVQVKYVIHN